MDIRARNWRKAEGLAPPRATEPVSIVTASHAQREFRASETWRNTSRRSTTRAEVLSKTRPTVLRVQISLEQILSSGNLEACEPFGQDRNVKLPATVPQERPTVTGYSAFFSCLSMEPEPGLLLVGCAEPVLELINNSSAVHLPESLPIDAPAPKCSPLKAVVRQSE